MKLTMKNIFYPKCSNSLKQWLQTNPIYMETYNNINPRIFDVTLRDGLQSVKKNDQFKYTTEVKLEMYNNIVNKYNPTFLEVGSLVSPKVLPILADSLEIYKQIKSENNFLLIPNQIKLKDALYNGCKNISLISSVSEKFQLTNTKKNLKQTKSDILDIMYELDSNLKISNPIVKLYLSCIDHCPISGQIPLDTIIKEIKYYNDICKPDIICLSDTCGNLSHQNFIEIVDKSYELGVPYSNLSLHLHIDMENLENVQKIFSSALDRNISEFDISLLESGGCSVTMGSKTKPNLSYELYYKFLVDYIMEKYIKR